MAAHAAGVILPRQMPEFFREATDQLAYLNPEPDRWRSRSASEMDRAWTHDHYLNLERVPEPALGEPDRFAYLDALRAAGLATPERDGGLLLFRIVELYQRLVAEWALWRAERDTVRRGWIEQRIINDAGILGHYVTDASQPQHTTIHFNGWDRGSSNPEGYTTDRDFHARFETAFVNAHLTQGDVSRLVTTPPRSVAGMARPTVLEHIRAAHARVEELHRLDRDFGFRPDRPARRETRDFAAERLADGARMLADLWWSAWLESASAE